MYRALGRNRLIYRAHIAYYVRTGLLDQAIKVFDEMTQSECRVFSVDYNRFIGVLIANCRFDLAEQYYRDMQPRGFSLSSFTYSRFISGLCQVKNFELIDRLLVDMDRLEVVPDIWACNIYLNLLCSEKYVDFALEILRVMGEKGREPDVVSYTTVINGLLRVGRIDEAVELWRVMVRKVSDLDNKACRALVLGLIENGKVDLAYELILGEMKDKVKLSTEIYNALIHGYCKAGRIDKAQAIKRFMRKNGCEPDLVTYNVLLNFCCDELMLDEAEQLMANMEKGGLELDSYSYNELIKGLCRANRVDKAYMLMVNKMEIKGLIDVVTFNTIIGSLCMAGHIKRAYSLFSEMALKGISPDVVTFTILIEAFLKEGHSSLAKRLLDQMTEMGLYPDHVLYTVIIDHLCKSGRVGIARGMFYDIIAQGQVPDVVCYNALICGFCGALRVDEAMHLYEEMHSRGLCPDGVTFRLIIRGLIRENKISLACSVWDQMMEKGFTLESDLSSTLIEAINSKDASCTDITNVQRLQILCALTYLDIHDLLYVRHAELIGGDNVATEAFAGIMEKDFSSSFISNPLCGYVANGYKRSHPYLKSIFAGCHFLETAPNKPGNVPTTLTSLPRCSGYSSAVCIHLGWHQATGGLQLIFQFERKVRKGVTMREQGPNVTAPFHGQNVSPTSRSPDPLIPPAYDTRFDVPPVTPQQPRPIINTKPRNHGKHSDEIPGRQVHFGGRDQHDSGPSQHPQHSPRQPHQRPSSLRVITGGETRPLAWFIAAFCALFWIIIIVVGLTVLIIFLVYRPRLPKFDISTATLNAAYLDMGYLLNADFTILANFTNPNTKVNVDFSYVILDLYYENNLISTRYIEPFTAFKSVSTFQTVHMVTSQVRLPFSTTQDLTMQINEGRVDFEVKGLFRTRSMLGGVLKYSYWLYSHCTITVTGPPTGVLVSKKCSTKR
ncbi:OLC1v1028452C1 [Oldenlandia corymbosa var. corymbosa]|uniref:OLC1v1028452C1 n=1 Tax=Oldenlandia corymbosa var. corymbosa TaxID=529605 RepID=A0AAV1CBR1_OLDCO|nr:OLC1v1028452C1 [Oldenlandia corymbosa var. corymbosa]